MSVKVGTKYQITNAIKGYYNSAETMTITRLSGSTVQFILEDGKGYGSMPIQHLQYLLKRTELTIFDDKKQFLQLEEQEQDIS
ncbi:hypothetical protein [Robertmurraya andreesenii]|uniref:Uncharacterized protein n=1 Tax=Anoxybacillus andreesenii TaxID=1325932 RepID=A0ABT9V0T9_9BACL|nr:hypothetical protein [Robertmurraya andreesenii]MDQ0154570.1 hypothetical protein [Robertmurraya andreesenii]